MRQPDNSAKVLTEALRPHGLVAMRRFEGGQGAFAVPVGRVTHRLVAHWIGDGLPARVREVVRDVGMPWPRAHVVTARHLSPGAIALLKNADANWVEADGRVHIRTNSGLVVERDVPSRPAARALAPFRWSPARADVAEILLATESVPAVREIARLSGWSREQVSEALRQFDRQGWTTKRGAQRGRTAARAIAATESLRESWAEQVASSPRERVLVHGLMREPLSFLQHRVAPALSEVGRWAVSGWAGSALIAPRVTSIPVLQIYVETVAFESRLRASLESAGLREVSTGERIEFWDARPAALYEPLKRRGLPVVHPNRLYADLLALGDRGREAAQEVLEELIAR